MSDSSEGSPPQFMMQPSSQPVSGDRRRTMIVLQHWAFGSMVFDQKCLGGKTMMKQWFLACFVYLRHWCIFLACIILMQVMTKIKTYSVLAQLSWNLEMVCTVLNVVTCELKGIDTRDLTVGLGFEIVSQKISVSPLFLHKCINQPITTWILSTHFCCPV